MSGASRSDTLFLKISTFLSAWIPCTSEEVIATVSEEDLTYLQNIFVADKMELLYVVTFDVYMATFLFSRVFFIGVTFWEWVILQMRVILGRGNVKLYGYVPSFRRRYLLFRKMLVVLRLYKKRVRLMDPPLPYLPKFMNLSLL